MRAQHALHVALAERNSGLQQVAAAGSQHRHLAHAQLSRDQQAVEAIIIERAGAHGAKRGDQLLCHARYRYAMKIVMFQLEILQPRPAAIRPVQPIGPLGNHAQTKVLEGRQYLRDRQRFAATDDAQVHALVRLARRAVESQLHRIDGGVQALQIDNVLDRLRRIDVLLVRRRECDRVAAIESQAVRLAKPAEQRGTQPIAPRDDGSGDITLEPRGVHARVGRRVDPHHDVQLSQRCLTDRQAGFELQAAAGGL